VEVLSRYLETHPDDAAAYAQRAFETALQAGLNFADRNPEMIQGLLASACEDYSAAIRLQPDNGAYYYERGHAYRMRNLYRQAAADYSRALERIHEREKRVEILGMRATCYSFLQQRDWVVRDFDAILSMVQEPSRRLTYLLSRAGFHPDYEAKIADLSEALEIDPSNADIWLTRAWTYAEMGKFNAALQDVANGEALADAKGRESFQHLRRKIRDMRTDTE
jgi:tetratricopeptide (TPR) repeat protein